MRSIFKGEEELRTKENQSLWSPLINVGDEQWHKKRPRRGKSSERLDGELVMEHPARDRSLKWAARTQADTDAGLAWLAAPLNLDKSGVSPSSPSKTGGKLLPTERGAEAQTKHNDFGVTDGEPVRYIFTATGEVSTHHYVTPRSLLHVHYSGERKKLFREAFVMEK